MCNWDEKGRLYSVIKLKSNGVGRKHECIPALKEFQSRLLVVRLQRVKRDFYLGKHQILKPSLI